MLAFGFLFTAQLSRKNCLKKLIWGMVTSFCFLPLSASRHLWVITALPYDGGLFQTGCFSASHNLLPFPVVPQISVFLPAW